MPTKIWRKKNEGKLWNNFHGSFSRVEWFANQSLLVFFRGASNSLLYRLPDARCKSSFWIEWFPIYLFESLFLTCDIFQKPFEMVTLQPTFFLLHHTSFGSCSLDVFFHYRVAFILISANQLKVYRFLQIITFSFWEDKNKMCAVCERSQFCNTAFKMVDRVLPTNSFKIYLWIIIAIRNNEHNESRSLWEMCQIRQLEKMQFTVKHIGKWADFHVRTAYTCSCPWDDTFSNVRMTHAVSWGKNERYSLILNGRLYDHIVENLDWTWRNSS